MLKRMMVGRRVIAGTILGRIGRTSATVSPHLHFEIRPAGRGAPRIDPKPILDGWKLLESTAIYRAQGRNALVDRGASIGQILLMSKEALAQHVLANPRIEIYSCGRRDIEAGIVDRRVLATLEFLAASGLKPTVTSLRCGHSYYTASGSVSEHSAGSAVDIAKINGIPIVGHQGEGSIADMTIRRLLTLQGTVKPHQIISLMKYDGTDNTLALGDHADHIHVGLPAGVPRGLAAVRRDRRRPQAVAVDQAHRPARLDRQPDGRREGLEVRHPGAGAARVDGASRRVARRRAEGAPPKGSLGLPSRPPAMNADAVSPRARGRSAPPAPPPTPTRAAGRRRRACG